MTRMKQAAIVNRKQKKRAKDTVEINKIDIGKFRIYQADDKNIVWIKIIDDWEGGRFSVEKLEKKIEEFYAEKLEKKIDEFYEENF